MNTKNNAISPSLKHLAIIMDGNGRWAKTQGLDRFHGHAKGTQVAEEIIEECIKNKIPYLTLFAFSTENWGRPKLEVDFLFSLLEKHLNEKSKDLLEKNVRLETIGDLNKLPNNLRQRILSLKEESKGNTGLTLIFALNYGGRDEIASAARKLAEDIASNKISGSQVTPQLLQSYLQTHSWPDPDLVIRTSGEKRISNFMIWQMAYSELYFCDKLWPDFTSADLFHAIDNFNCRERRYGGLCKEDSAKPLNTDTTSFNPILSTESL